MTRNSAFLALAFAAVLVVCEFAVFMASGQSWPFWTVGFIVAGVLSWGAVRTLSQGSSRLLSAAWGVSVGVFWMSFFAHTEALNTGTESPYSGAMLSGGPLTLLLAAMLVVSIAGLLLSLSRRSI
jgi:hypothetical protein